MRAKTVEFSGRFDKDLRRAPMLRNHSLSGKYKGCRSINVSGDWRAIFREYKGGAVIYFEMLGTHSELYG